MRKKQVYMLKPLSTLADYQKYFEARCQFNRKLFPAFKNYYKGKYEIDIYDKYSLAIGLFVENEDGFEVAGFARVTQVINSPLYLKHRFNHDVLDFINLGISTKTPHPELPLLETHQKHAAFLAYISRLRNENRKICECGRLIVSKKISDTFTPTLSLINYTLSAASFHGVDYSLFQTKPGHASFYRVYFAAQPFGNGTESKNLKAMIPSAVDVGSPQGRSAKTRTEMLDIFKGANEVCPITFSDDEIQNHNVTVSQNAL